MSGYRSSGTRINKRIGSQGGSIDPDGSIDRPFYVYSDSYLGAISQLESLSDTNNHYAVVDIAGYEIELYIRLNNIWSPTKLISNKITGITIPDYPSTFFTFPSQTYSITNP